MIRKGAKELGSGKKPGWPTDGASPPTDVIELGTRWGRDLGAFSARNSSKGALVAETQAVFRALEAGTPLAKLRQQCLQGTILRQQACQTRDRIWQAIHWRFFSWRPPQWVLRDLAEAATDDASPRFVGLVYLHYARRDRLTFEFATAKLWHMWQSKTVEVRRDDVLDFLAACEDQHPKIRTWRETTRKKLAGNVLSALRDFGLLKGVRRKVIQQPAVSPEVALHLCRLLYAEGLRGRAVLEARDWRLCLWGPNQVAEALARLAQVGKLRFERSGKTVILELPELDDGGTDEWSK